MRSGLLLEYLSELGGGNWQSFRRAVAAAGARPGQSAMYVAGDLSLLGHVEFEPERLRWSVCPSALAELPFERPHRAVLCGARSSPFLGRCASVASELGVTLSSALEEHGVVERVVLEADEQARLKQLAGNLGVLFLPSAARRLARCLPDIEALLKSCPEEHVPRGEGLEWLDDADDGPSVRSRWTPVPEADRPGIYRQLWVYRQMYWLAREDGSARRVPRAVAYYGRYRALLRYDSATGLVTFPAQARPPALHLRALVLCAGTLPRYVVDGHSLQVIDIPVDVAAAVGARLDQEGFI